MDMSLKYEVNLYKNLLLDYCRHGDLHRVNSPADIYYNGGMFWFEFGEPHRIDGPSDVFYDGGEYYSIRGKPYSKGEYDNVIKIQGNYVPDF